MKVWSRRHPVQAALEAAARVKAKEEERQDIVQQASHNGHHSTRPVLRAKIRHGGIVVVVVPEATTDVVETYRCQDVCSHIEHLHIGEQVEGGKSTDEGGTHIPLLLEVVEAGIEWSPQPG